MIPTRRWAALISVVVLLFAFAVYMLTLTPTVPFWDSGEFIAVAKILGVPHPPGTPFVVLIGRLATLVPWKSVAERVNAVSAVCSALAVLLTYLCILRMLRITQGGDRKPWQEWTAIVGAAAGALMLAFSDNWWENSIEAEVYQMMSLFTMLVFWMGLRWWEAHEKRPTVGPLLVATYVLWLSMGLHPAVAPTALPLLILVALVDRRVAVLFGMPLFAMLFATTGMEHLIGAVLVLGCVQCVYFAMQKKLSGMMLLVNFAGTAVGVYYAYSDANFTAWGGISAALGLILPLASMARRHREGRILLLVVLLMVLGYSTNLYLPIRAAHHPAVNEGAPATWEKMRDLLERKQYGEMHMLPRRGKILETQLNKEFWRYFSRQWPILPGARAPWSALIPLLLGLAGAVHQGRRDLKGFTYTFVLFGLNTAGLIVFLNFTDHEVRDRDYFFQTGYHAYAIWIGFGIAWLIGWVRESFSERRPQQLATVGSAALLCAMPLLLMRNLWFEHDRSHNYIARDYAYNMLATLKPNSFMFTNGDNDTFPLWYIQQVEGFRKDVTIVNLSLLNTDWYIRQLRDEEPKVPIKLDDRTIDMLGAGAFQDEKGNIIYTNEFMVHHLLEQARKDTGWVKQPYFAVTVPQDFGYAPYFRQEGIVQEVMRDSLQAGFDEPATHKALYETFKYRGLLTADGSWDKTVYKDDNAQNLSRNYAFAHMQLAMYYRRLRQYPKAIAEMERVQRMFPDWVEIQVPLGGIYLAAGDTAKAWEFYDGLAQRAPQSAEAHYYRGAALGYRGRQQDALDEFRLSRKLDPNYAYPYYDEFATLWEMGRREEAVQVLQQYVDLHPGDAEGNARLQEARARLNAGPGSAPLGVPPGTRPR